jgi:hypothetical protein
LPAFGPVHQPGANPGNNSVEATWRRWYSSPSSAAAIFAQAVNQMPIGRIKQRSPQEGARPIRAFITAATRSRNAHVS